MTQPELRNELLIAAAEPLLPAEKKLTGWSLAAGLALLGILVAVTHYFPAYF
jgi:hypothetical protein